MTDNGYLYEYFLKNSPGEEPAAKEEDKDGETAENSPSQPQ